MKPWLQVLFAQGYLLRDFFPDDFMDEQPEASSPNFLNLALAASFSVLGVVTVWQGALIYGSVLIATGIAWVVWSGDGLGAQRFFGTKAFWISVSWGSGAATVLGWFVVTLLSAIFVIWPMLLGFGAFVAFFGTMSLRHVQRRYLYFAQRNSAWDSDPVGGSLKDWFIDTYWRLPREVLKTMFHRPKAAV